MKCKLLPAVIFALTLMAGGCKSSSAPQDKQQETQQESAGFRDIFDGKTLTGWKGDTSYWRVEDGNIVGQSTPENPIKTNTFLIWQDGQPEDFELMAQVRISKDGNSGIQYRSEAVPDVPNGLKGYQSDIDGTNVYSGINYEERGRGILAQRGQRTVLESGKEPQVIETFASGDSLKTVIKNGDWNDMHVIVKGNNMKHYLNGVLMSEVTDNDSTNRKFKGVIGLQAHAGAPMMVEYRNIKIK
jgi:hypothetical protein